MRKIQNHALKKFLTKEKKAKIGSYFNSRMGDNLAISRMLKCQGELKLEEKTQKLDDGKIPWHRYWFFCQLLTHILEP